MPKYVPMRHELMLFFIINIFYYEFFCNSDWKTANWPEARLKAMLIELNFKVALVGMLFISRLKISSIRENWSAHYELNEIAITALV